MSRLKAVSAISLVLVFFLTSLAFAVDKLYVRDTNFSAGNPVDVTTPDAIAQLNGVACVDPATNSIISAWVEQTATNQEVRVQKIAPDGTRQWGDQGSVVFSIALPNQFVGTQIVCIGNGEAVVAAVDVTNAQVHLQKVTDAAPTGAWTPHVVINPDLADPGADTVNPLLALGYDNDPTNPSVVVGYKGISAGLEAYFVRGVGVRGAVDGQYRYNINAVFTAGAATSTLDFSGMVQGNPGNVWVLVVENDPVTPTSFWNAVSISNTGGLLYPGGYPGTIYGGPPALNNVTQGPCFMDRDGAGGAIMACAWDPGGAGAPQVDLAGVDATPGAPAPYNPFTVTGPNAGVDLYGISFAEEGATDYVFVLYNNGGAVPNDVWLDKIQINPLGGPSTFPGSKWTVGGALDVSTVPVDVGGLTLDTAETPHVRLASVGQVVPGNACAAYTWIEVGPGLGRDLYAQVICDDPAGTSAMALFKGNLPTGNDVPKVIDTAAADTLNTNDFLAAHGSAYVMVNYDPDGIPTNTYRVNSFSWMAVPDLYWQTAVAIAGTTSLDLGLATGHIDLAAGSSIVENNGQDASQATTVDFYLAEDGAYATWADWINDVKIHLEEVPLPLLAIGGNQAFGGHVINVNMADLAPARYWANRFLCAVINEGDPADTENVVQEHGYYLSDNNISCAPVSFDGPDLRVTASAAIGNQDPGDTVTLTGLQMDNNGTTDAGAFRVCYYLWNTIYGLPANLADLRANGREIRCDNYSSLAAGANLFVAGGEPSITIPDDINGDVDENRAADLYQIYAVIDVDDQVAETDERFGPGINLNCREVSGGFNINPHPDLEVDSSIVWPPDNVVQAGQTVQISYTITNKGWTTPGDAGCSAATTARFFLSEDDVFVVLDPITGNWVPDPNDIELDSRPVPSLMPYATGSWDYSFSETVNITVPAGTASGSYYIYAYVDPPSQQPPCAEEMPSYTRNNASPVEPDSQLWVNNNDWDVQPRSFCMVPGDRSTAIITAGYPPYNMTVTPPGALGTTLNTGFDPLNPNIVNIEALAVGAATITIDDAEVLGLTNPIDLDVVVNPVMTANPADVTMGVGGSATVNILGGCGAYSITAGPDPAVANAALVGSVLTIQGVGVGDTTVTISDEQRGVGHEVAVNIHVVDGVVVSGPTCLAVGDSDTVSVVGGVAPYNVTCSPAGIITGCPGAGFPGGDFNITAVGPGIVNIMAVDDSGSSDFIDVTVNAALSVDSSAVSLYPTQDTDVTISGGCGPYQIEVQPDPGVATAVLTGNTLTITAVGVGSTSVRINDTIPGNPVTVYIIVNPTPTMGIDPSTLELRPGDSGSATIYGGVPPYSVQSITGTGAAYVTATITDSTVNVSVDPGAVESSAVVTIEDDVGQTALLAVEIVVVPPTLQITANTVGANLVVTAAILDAGDYAGQTGTLAIWGTHPILGCYTFYGVNDWRPCPGGEPNTFSYTINIAGPYTVLTFPAYYLPIGIYDFHFAADVDNDGTWDVEETAPWINWRK